MSTLGHRPVSVPGLRWEGARATQEIRLWRSTRVMTASAPPQSKTPTGSVSPERRGSGGAGCARARHCPRGDAGARQSRSRVAGPQPRPRTSGLVYAFVLGLVRVRAACNDSSSLKWTKALLLVVAGTPGSGRAHPAPESAGLHDGRPRALARVFLARGRASRGHSESTRPTARDHGRAHLSCCLVLACSLMANALNPARWRCAWSLSLSKTPEQPEPLFKTLRSTTPIIFQRHSKHLKRVLLDAPRGPDRAEDRAVDYHIHYTTICTCSNTDTQLKRYGYPIWIPHLDHPGCARV